MIKKKNKEKFIKLVYANGFREPLYCFKQFWFPIQYLNNIDITTAPIQANLAKYLFDRLENQSHIVGVYVDDPDRYLMITLSNILKYKK
tara:strand:- start:226 stop:492 length:267 start_codon:yes stop_codon:yes gene_type:complete